MEKLERMLAQWIEHQNKRAIPLSTSIIQAKARSLFDELNAVQLDPKVSYLLRVLAGSSVLRNDLVSII